MESSHSASRAQAKAVLSDKLSEKIQYNLLNRFMRDLHSAGLELDARPVMVVTTKR